MRRHRCRQVDTVQRSHEAAKRVVIVRGDEPTDRIGTSGDNHNLLLVCIGVRTSTWSERIIESAEVSIEE